MLAIYGPLQLILGIVYFVMIAHIIMSWLINFQVLNLRQPIVAQIYFGLNRLLEPLYAPIRRYLPSAGGLDFSPIIVFLGIIILRIIIIQNFI